MQAIVDIAPYEPDIAPNAGTILRMGACLGVPVHIIGPTGFDLSDRSFRRAGVPDDVHERADARLLVPMRPGMRSLNVAVACAMATGEALRQIGRQQIC